MERVSDRAGASRRRLLQAAAEELIASGDVEVAAVARRAGMSTGLPYHYFGTRSGLMSALLEDFYERLIADTVLGHYEGATWLERWRAQVATWVEHMYADPLAPVVLGRMVGDARVAALEAQCFKRVIDLGAKHFAASQAEGHVAGDRDPELLAAAVVGGMRAILAIVLNQSPRPDQQAVMREVWLFTVSALGVTGDRDGGAP
ncbi:MULTISPECIES: TetR/AcrR family transcriptional regulator [Nonomuraea]|uniref:TetR/AcrR family transcriptional regulator n=1 Tax=Nonomuraea ferruginea TaxID=46174 RepID=A0ABT4STH5_9ACTN|nr:TetR/AcrR family transcriptional regulator [Nonomuraea ferruginea]MDA0640569.1 TetR/AcrR family transcriptional regulator [Nonomuraea ferruginea]